MLRGRQSLLILLAILCLGAASNGPSPGGGKAQGQQKAEAADHHEAGGGAQSLPQAAAAAVQHQQAASQDYIAAQPQREGNWYTSPDWWVAGFTAALFVATTGLWVFTALLWRATKRAVKDTDKSIRIANRGLKHAKRASERELRAYVHVAEGYVHGIGGTEPWYAIIKLENGGQTPAYNVRNASVIRADSFPADRPILEIPEISENAGRTMMGPRGTLNQRPTLTDKMTPQKTQLLISGKAAIWVTGRVLYDDAFGHPHWVTYRYFCGGPVAWNGGGLSPHATGNDTDQSDA